MKEQLLQQSTDWMELWKQGRWFEAMFGPYTELLTRPGVILLLVTPLTLALWMQSDSIYVPAVLLVLFAGLFIGGAPPAAAVLGYLIVAVATTLAFRAIYGGGLR